MDKPFFEDDSLTIHHCAWQTLMAELADESIDLVMSDPPYGIDFQSNQRVATKQFKKIAGDVEPPLSVVQQMYRVLKPDSACYLFTRWDVQQLWIEECEKAGFTVKNILVWDKEIHGMGDLNGDWGTSHENIIYAVKGDHTLNRPRPTTVIRVQKVSPGEMIHPNQKPIGVWYRMIRASSKRGDIILDTFTGSCSSMLAVRQLGRRGLGCDIDQEWLSKALPMLDQQNLFQTYE